MRSASRTFVSTFGGFAALMGIEHGIGEILQGVQDAGVTTGSVFIESWPDSPFFEVLSGEPAMTVIPNLLVTGILAVIFSLLYFVWAVPWIDRKRSGQAMMLLAVPMVLFGAGLFPPFLGLLIGATAATAQAKRPPQKARQWRDPSAVSRFLAVGWPWAFAACLLTWLAMFPGVPVLNYFFGFYNADLIFAILILMFVLLGLAWMAGIARDRGEQAFE